MQLVRNFELTCPSDPRGLQGQAPSLSLQTYEVWGDKVLAILLVPHLAPQTCPRRRSHPDKLRTARLVGQQRDDRESLRWE